jgi:hypothetical protein
MTTPGNMCGQQVEYDDMKVDVVNNEKGGDAKS